MKIKNKRGGARKGSGAKPLEAKDKKQPLAFQIKYGLHAEARLRIQPIVNEINQLQP